ncbi:MAG: cupredoxin domain-containing protein [Solirubrobacteraceae bacterium]
MPVARALPRIVAAAFAALAVAGCGGAGPTVRERDGRVAIVLDDFSISPQRVRVPAGEVAFDVVNRGRAGHNFRLKRGEGEPVKLTTLLPGDRERAAGRVRRGDYKMVCTVANHEELGMYGTLVVR